MKTMQINYFIGLTTQSGKEIEMETAKKVISNIMQESMIDGYSIRPQFGYWRGVEEKSIMVSIVNADGRISPYLKNRIGVMLRTTFDQETVMVTEVPVYVDFV